MRAACVVVVCLGACGSDPTLDVIVHHPTGTVIARTTITVYASSDLTCDDVRFGDVDATELAGLQVAEETLFADAATQGALDNLPRVDHKVVVARGFGADDKLAAAGCAEAGEVTTSLTLDIDTESAVLASITPNLGSDGNDTYGVDVTVADPGGTLVAGRAVSWRVFGPAGTKPAVSGATSVGDASAAVWERAQISCTDASGVANLHPIPPDLIGGYEVRARIAWTQEPIAPVSLFTKLDTGLGAGSRVSLTGTTAHPCAIGHVAGASPPRVAGCINGLKVDLFDAQVSAAGDETLTVHGSVSVARPVAVFSLPEANGTDVDILAIDATPGLGSAKVVSVYGKNPGGNCPTCGLVDDVQVVPDCGPGLPALLLAHITTMSGADGIEKLDATFGATPFDNPVVGFTASFNAAGCVTRLDTSTGTPTTVQAIVLDFAPTTDSSLVGFSRMIYDCATKCAKIDLPIPGAGAGFTTGTTPTLIATTIDATGVNLGSFIMISGTNGNVRADHLVPLSTIPSVAIPQRITTGQFDSDNQADLVWDNAAGRRPLIQVGYARVGPDGPLSAFGASPANISDLIVGDLTSDGFDDVLVAGQGVVSVIPTRVTARTGEVRADAAVMCPPE